MSPPHVDRTTTILWALAGIALLVLFWMLRPILTPFVVGATLAYLGNPAVNWLVEKRFPRPLAAALMVCAMGVSILLLLLIVIPVFWREITALIARLPELFEMFNERILPKLNRHFDVDISLDIAFLRQWLTEHQEEARNLLPHLLSHARSGGLALISVAINLVLIPVVMFYLLQEWPRIIPALRDMIPRPMIARTTRFMADIDSVLSEFLRGQVSVMLILAAYYTVGLWFAGLSSALPVGILTGLISFIPFIGFSGGILLALLSAMLQGGEVGLLTGVVIVYILGQLIESYVLTPYLVGERIGLHPLAVIFALMAFGLLFGFIGMLIALPASAAILVALREIRSEWLESPIYLGMRKQDTE